MTRLVFVAPALAFGLFMAAAQGQADDKSDKKPKRPPVPGKLADVNVDDLLKRLDKNGDGALDKDELPPRLQQFFDRADKNGDGKLDKKELAAIMEGMRRRGGPMAKKGAPKGGDDGVRFILERMDSNKDGKISKDEAKGPLAKGFDRLDKNKDGYLDKSELREVAQRIAAMRKDGKGGQPGEGGPRGRDRRDSQDFDSLDRNADGRLTKEEVKGTPFAEAFDKIDANKDGKIDRKELEAYLKKQADKKDLK